MLRELAIICITPPLESKPLMMTRLRAIDTRKCAVLGTDTSTRCAITDSIKSPPKIVFLRVKSSDVRRVLHAGRTGSEA